jgi:hypothetical protein
MCRRLLVTIGLTDRGGADSVLRCGERLDVNPAVGVQCHRGSRRRRFTVSISACSKVALPQCPGAVAKLVTAPRTAGRSPRRGVCTTNTAQAKDKSGVSEDSYSDNTISVSLRSAGDNVTEVPLWTRIRIVHLAHELDPGWLLELWLAIHGGDPGPAEIRLKETEELMAGAASIVRELATSELPPMVGVTGENQPAA